MSTLPHPTKKSAPNLSSGMQDTSYHLLKCLVQHWSWCFQSPGMQRLATCWSICHEEKPAQSAGLSYACPASHPPEVEHVLHGLVSFRLCRCSRRVAANSETCASSASQGSCQAVDPPGRPLVMQTCRSSTHRQTPEASMNGLACSSFRGCGPRNQSPCQMLYHASGHTLRSLSAC